MNVDRINKLQDFANEFNRKLKLSEESEIEENKIVIPPLNKRIKKSYSMASNNQLKRLNYNDNIPFLNNKKNNQEINRPTKSSKKKQGKVNNNIYKNLLPWIPPHYIGKYFEEFKLLQDKHNLSTWEKVRNIFLYLYINYIIE